MKRQAILFSLPFLFSLVLCGEQAFGQSALENPAPNSFQSGIGVLSGWKCTGGTIVAQFDGGPSTQAAYGTGRSDTQAACGDINNGFGVLVNWNLLSGGQHTVRLFDNGVQFAETSFTVVTTGQQFLHGLVSTAIAPQFPLPELDTVLAWQESLQNFVIIGSSPHVPASGVAQKCTEHIIFDISSELIKLEDGSVLQVNFVDEFKILLWFFSQRVLLCTLNRDIGDQRTLINLDTHGSCIVRVSVVSSSTEQALPPVG